MHSSLLVALKDCPSGENLIFVQPSNIYAMNVRIKRAYAPPEKADGIRILVDRLWPRGLTKEKAAVDLWLKDIAPTPTLRQWFGHEPARWEAFRKRYHLELTKNPEQVQLLKEQLKKGPVTLVYAAKDEMHNGAVALKDFLEHH
jgi:uncharacterized protein YeaO (DUF488 family)